MISAALLARWRFFMQHAGYCTPPGRVACALALARAEEEGLRRGLYFGEFADDSTWDVLWCAVYRCGADLANGVPPLASIGGVGLDALSDPYLEVIRAELFTEALARLDAEDQAAADQLAARATFAGGI